MKSYKILLPFLIFLSFFAGCEAFTEADSDDSNGSTAENSEYFEGSTGDALVKNCSLHEDASDYTWNSSDVVAISLNETSISVNGSGASASGSTVTITSAGTYSFSGTLSDGQVIVNTEDEDVVRLILNDTDITCSDSAPIYIAAADKAIVILKDNTENYLTDGSTYAFESADVDEPNAALFSKSDLTVFGYGSLTVEGNYKDGIASKDGLIIKNGNINVDAVDDGIRGKDYIVVDGADIKVNAKTNGLKSDDKEDVTKGFIYISDGNIHVVSGGDGFTAQTDVLIAGGTINIVAGGGSSGTLYLNVSTKGIKAVVNTIVDDGNITISSTDDAMHSNGNLSINGGIFSLSTKDDGIHSDAEVTINDGDINITKSYEGIESAIVTINGGTIHITSSDDGLNVAGGNDGSGGVGGPGGGGFDAAGDYYMYINGGYVFIDAYGDGVDSNGYIEMTGGEVIVIGPTSNANGAIDYNGSFKISGGFLAAAGSSGMAQAPGTGSSQYSLLFTFSTKPSGTLFHIQNSDGDDILNFRPTRQYQSIAFSSPDLKKGSTYDVYMGGSSSGTETDGIYSGGTYTPGTRYSSFTISSSTTKVRL